MARESLYNELDFIIEVIEQRSGPKSVPDLTEAVLDHVHLWPAWYREDHVLEQRTFSDQEACVPRSSVHNVDYWLGHSSVVEVSVEHD